MKKFSAGRDHKLANEASVLYVVIGILFLFFLISCTSEATTNKEEKPSQVSDSFPMNIPGKAILSEDKENNCFNSSRAFKRKESA